MADPSEDRSPSPTGNPRSRAARSGREDETRDRPVVIPSGALTLPLLPPPANPPVGRPSTGQAGDSASRPSKKKAKVGEEAVGEEPGKRRKPASLENLPGRARTCGICRREFATARALFGHMRCHPERSWRGAHPPPVSPRRGAEGEHEGADVEKARQEEDLARSLLDIGERILRTEKFKAMTEGHRGDPSTASPLGTGGVVGAMEIGWMRREEEREAEERRKRIHYRLDLNKEAPVDEDEADDGDEMDDETPDATTH